MARKGSPRVARDVRAAIADALGSLVADPRLTLVTITEVELTPDHEHATVYWSTPDPGIVSDDRRRGTARVRPGRTRSRSRSRRRRRCCAARSGAGSGCASPRSCGSAPIRSPSRSRLVDRLLRDVLPPATSGDGPEPVAPEGPDGPEGRA
jgi:hypothetical protein